MSEQRDPIEYLLNAMNHAAVQDSPSEHDYYGKRQAVLAAIRELRQQANAATARADRLAEALRLLRADYGDGGVDRWPV